MTGLIPPGPLAYEGQLVVSYVARTNDPNQDFIHFIVPTIWINTSNGNIWILVGKALGIANWVLLGTGSSGPAIKFGVPLGSSPVLADGMGLVTFTSTSGTIAITGSSHAINFDLVGGGVAVESLLVQAATAPGTTTVIPISNQITVNGAAVAAHSVPIQTQSRAQGAYNIEAQVASTVAPTPANTNSVGLACFNNVEFTVDATSGMVSLVGGAIHDYHDSIYIVGASPSANYTTIAAAYAAAVAAGAPATVFIQPGTYTENITAASGINLCAHSCDSQGNVTIIGKISASFAGVMGISGIRLQTNSDYCISITGTSLTNVDLIDCNILATNNNAIQITSSGGPQIVFQACQGDLTNGFAYFTQSGNSLVQFVNCFMINNGASTTASTIAGSGSIELRNTFFYNSITSSATSNIIVENSSIGAAVIVGSTGISNAFSQSIIAGGTASAISISTSCTATLSNCTISSSNTNAITGSGTLRYGNLVFVGTSSTVNTSTQTALVTL